MDIKIDLFQWLTSFLIKNLKENSAATRQENSNRSLSTKSNQELANELNELHKTIIRKFKKQFTADNLQDDIWKADHAVMQLISK